MNTKAWGPECWKIIHHVAQKYPEEPSSKIRRNNRIFFNLIPKVLPCKYCRFSLKQFYKENPIRLDNNEEMTRWLYNIHNSVNKKLLNQGLKVGKIPTLENIRKKYSNNLPGNNFLRNNDKFLGCVIYNYPVKTPSQSKKNNIRKLVKYLLILFPDNNCTDFIKKNPLDDKILSSRNKLKYWFCKSPLSKHNKLEKQDKLFESYRAKCSNGTCR